MKAHERCKAHSQGDRCRKALDHEGADPIHEGQFAIWQESKFRQEKFPRTAARRHRSINRFVGALSRNSHLVPDIERARLIGMLGRVIRHFKGAA